MKKWFLLAFAGLLTTSMAIFSCQKDQVQIGVSKTNMNQLSREEQDLMRHLKSTYMVNASDRVSFWSIVGADAVGALGGAAAGSVLPAVGTTAGAIIGGAGASLEHAGSCLQPDGGGNGQPNDRNPFDAAGMHHNACLQANLAAFYSLSPSDWTNELLYGYGETYVAEVMGEDPAPYWPLVFPPSAYLYELLRNAGQDADISAIIYQMLEAGYITPIQADVTNAYYLNVIPLEDGTFYEASVSFELDVLNSGIENSDKDAILAALAVGRYSRGFWFGE